MSPIILRTKVAELTALWRQTLEAQRQAELLRLLIEGTKEYAIFVLDTQGNVVTWNKAGFNFHLTKPVEPDVLQRLIGY